MDNGEQDISTEEAAIAAVLSRHGGGIRLLDLFVRASRVAGEPLTEAEVLAVLGTQGADPEAIVYPGRHFGGGRPTVVG